MSASSSLSPAPPTSPRQQQPSAAQPQAETVLQYALYSRAGVHFYNWTAPNGTPSPVPSMQFDGATKIQYSKDGTIAAVVRPDDVLVVNTSSGVVISTLPRPRVLRVAISPLGNYIVTWERLDEANPDANLLIWKVGATPQIISKFTKKAAPTVVSWPMIHWSPDEKYCARSVSEGVQVFPVIPGPLPSLNIAMPGGAAAVAWSPNPQRHFLALFTLSRKGQPGSVVVYDCDVPLTATVPTELTRKTFFFEADSCGLEWSPATATGGPPVLLAHAQSDVDPTGKSYYGASALYYVHATRPEFSGTINLRKEGTIHHVSWHPTGKLFSVVYGYMPAMVTVFEVGPGGSYSAKSDLGPASRNITLWAPTGTAVCIGGFGNLQGEMDFFAVREANSGDTKFFRAGKAQAHTTTSWIWSADGSYLSCAVCAPRRRVDNGFRVFNAKGEQVYTESNNELYEFIWKPDTKLTASVRKSLLANPAEVKSLEQQADKAAKQAQQQAAQAPPPSQAKYRPPGARGIPSQPVGMSAPAQEQASFSSPNKPKKAAPVVNKQSFPSLVDNYVPGAAPDGPSKAEKAAAKKQKRLEKKRAEKTQSPTPVVGDPASASSPSSSPVPASASAPSPVAPTQQEPARN